MMQNKKRLAAVVGASAAAMLIAQVTDFEGMVLRGYRDPVGIATKCAGDTTNVTVGQVYTLAECQASLESQLVAHAEPVLKCTPGIVGNTYRVVGVISFAYNVGYKAYCGSTTARRFNAGDVAGACRAMNESDTGRPQWVTARGAVLPGLVKRRAIERKLCEGKKA